MGIINNSYKKILQEFANLFIQTVYEYAKFYTNDKVGKDTLSNSDLIKSLKVSTTDNDLIITINSYYEYVERGREIGEKKVPLSALIIWIKKKSIALKNKSNNYRGKAPSINKLAYAIQAGIFKSGIAPRPFISDAFVKTQQTLDKYLDEQTNLLLDAMLDNLLVGKN